ncbi:TrmB family transcriptional regulator [Halapricum desulfuricans]|uniref:Sugar-specific transcriptional regulator TrmB n=1 Tax=Halapricum desulfuricans TaxID=2841257 RepID=A0A897NG20_9EURY|nr:TrmB family transcriptional regulator [Halapricum desulfuricans]QSG09849.1 Sugar-specific transcriptional regulator TrmB [Halapricum desulfuricans]
MNESELEASLETAGFAPYQASAYVALLELGAATVPEIAEKSGVPDSRIYDVLRSLESEGYVEVYEQESLQARVYDHERLQEQLRERAELFSDAREEIERRWEEPPMEETVVNAVTRFETVVESAADAIATADTQVQLSVGLEQYRELRPALRTARENGASVYLVISTPDSEALPDPESVAAVCTEARHRELPSPFVAIVDRSKVYFAPHTDSANEYGLIVDDRTHAYVLHWFFLTNQWTVWDSIASSGQANGEYIDVRYLVDDLEPLLENGKRVRVHVDGADTDSGQRRSVEGVVRDVVYENDGAGPTARGGRVTLELDTDAGTVEVGGWGALVEDIEAHRLRVESVT